MLISHRKKFIYTKTIKTAGTSVESYFEKYCRNDNVEKGYRFGSSLVSSAGIIGHENINAPDMQWHNHMSAKEIKRKLGNKCWQEYFKFCVIRDPFDKTVSLFHYREARKKEQLPDYSKELPTFERFRIWLDSSKLSVDKYQFLMNNKICMDYFIRYENLSMGVKHVCDVLDLPFEPARIPLFKAGHRPEGLSLADYYDAKAIAKVSEHYAFEIEHFGYKAPV